MDMKTDQIEKLFRKADFSKESDLKMNLTRQLFPVRGVTLNQLMEEEGIRTRSGEKDSNTRQRSASRQAERGRSKDPDSMGVIERDNPLIKKNRPPSM